MAVRKIKRPKLSWLEWLYVPSFIIGLFITVRHFFRRKITADYPERKWKPPPGFRGAPYLVRDHEGNVKCVACQLCEFICPPKAIRIEPPGPDGPVPDRPNAEKIPVRFEIDMLRCIYCGLCQEVCPEEAIFLSEEFTLVGSSRAELVFPMEELLRRGGKVYDPIQKWKRKALEAAEQQGSGCVPQRNFKAGVEKLTEEQGSEHELS